MKKNFSNRYIFIYITVLVIVIALVLSLAATLLQQRQDDNRKIEKMQSILRSAGIESSVENAMPLYQKYVTEELYDEHPVYVAQIDNGRIYIFPLRGKGLWGPVWGFIALKEDMNTVVGITLDHKGETPGLGAQITTAEFQNQFRGKKIFDDRGNFVSITLVKGGAGSFSGNRKHAVDAISGGTLTSNGVTEMLFSNLLMYEPFMKERLDRLAAPDTVTKQDTVKEVTPVYRQYRSDTVDKPQTPSAFITDTPKKSVRQQSVPEQEQQQQTSPVSAADTFQKIPEQPIPQQQSNDSQQSDPEKQDVYLDTAAEVSETGDTGQTTSKKENSRKRRSNKKQVQADEE